MPPTKVITTYLEMLSPEQLSPYPPSGLTVLEATVVCPELSRFLYTAVGSRWYWLDRLDWHYEQWFTHLTQKTIRTWVGYVGGNPAGYFELSRQADSSVLIAYFGLLPQFIGQGHGGYLLSKAIQQAWAWQAARVWVHTNNLDSPHALTNYQARGLKVYKKVETLVELPELPLEKWMG